MTNNVKPTLSPALRMARGTACGAAGLTLLAYALGATVLPGLTDALIGAVAIAWTGATVAMFVHLRGLGLGPAGLAGAILLGLGLRFGLTLGGGLLAWAAAPARAGDALLIALGVAQLALLVIDMTVLVGITRTASRPADGETQAA